jgi:hypothetical protein
VAISARLRRAPAHWYAYFGAGLALAVSAAFGGWQSVEEPTVPLRPGAVDVGEPWSVKVVSARLLQDLEPAVFLKNKEDHWLVVIAEVEVTDDHSRSDVNRILRVPTAPGIVTEVATGTSYDEYPFGVLLTRDGTRVDALHPGMTERVAYLWEQKPDSLPTQVDVDIIGMTWRKNSLTDTFEWLDERTRAKVTVPVEDKRNG